MRSHRPCFEQERSRGALEDPQTRAWGLRVPGRSGPSWCWRALRETVGRRWLSTRTGWKKSPPDCRFMKDWRVGPEGAAAWPPSRISKPPAPSFRRAGGVFQTGDPANYA